MPPCRAGPAPMLIGNQPDDLMVTRQEVRMWRQLPAFDAPIAPFSRNRTT